jgi:dTDP-glucose 4,6-dehydratase
MRSIVDNAAFFHTDVLGTHAVTEAFRLNAKRGARLIHISTSEVYGSASVSADGESYYSMPEDQPLDPMGPYAAAKCGADRLVSSYINTYGIKATILRPFNMYGPRQHIEKMIPRFTSCVLTGERMPVHGLGTAMRDFTHVQDVSRAVLAVVETDATVGGTFNIASGVGRAVKEVAADIAKHAGRGSTKSVANRPGQVQAHIGDASRIVSLCGWSPIVPWEEGLRDTVNWYAENETFWRRQMRMASIKIGGENL